MILADMLGEPPADERREPGTVYGNDVHDLRERMIIAEQEARQYKQLAELRLLESERLEALLREARAELEQLHGGDPR